MKEKTKEVLAKLDEYKNSEINNEMITEVMKIQALAKEIVE